MDLNKKSSSKIKKRKKEKLSQKDLNSLLLKDENELKEYFSNLKISSLTKEDILFLRENQKYFKYFLKANSNFLNKIISYFKIPKAEFIYEDIFQEASLQLYVCLQKYNPNLFDSSTLVGFSSFAFISCRNAISAFLATHYNEYYNNTVSLENFKYTSHKNEESSRSEYIENNFIKNSTPLEEEVENKILIENLFKKLQLSKIEKEILNKIFLNMSHVEIAKELNLNYKNYQYILMILKRKIISSKLITPQDLA